MGGGAQPIQRSRQVSPCPGVSCRRGVHLDHSFQKPAGFHEETPVYLVPSAAPLLSGYLSKPNLGLGEFVQCTGVRVDDIAGLLKVPMRNTRLPKASGQNSGIDGVLCERAFGELVQQAPCISLSTLVEQYFDPRIRNIGHCGFGPYVAKSDEDGLGRLRIVPLGVEPNHFRREHCRGGNRMPGILDSLERIVAPAHGAKVGGVLNR